MSKFNQYAQELDTTVKSYFVRYRSAERKVKELEARIREKEKEVQYLQSINDKKVWAARYELEGLKVQLSEARSELESVKKSNSAVLITLSNIRENLKNAADKEFAIDPEQVDQNTLELLKSGILKAADFEELYEKAEREKNYTMLRLMEPYLNDRVETVRKNGDFIEAQKLSFIAAKAGEHSTDHVVGNYDELTSVAKRALGDPNSYSELHSKPNPYFYEHWDEIVGETIDNF